MRLELIKGRGGGFFPFKNPMAPPALEVFRFTAYVFIPIGFFYYFNLPDYYNRYVKPDIVRLAAWGFVATYCIININKILQGKFHPSEGVHKARAGSLTTVRRMLTHMKSTGLAVHQGRKHGLAGETQGRREGVALFFC